MTESSQPPGRGGERLALAVGVGLLLGATFHALTGGETVVTTILVLVGASALGGFVRARRRR